MEESPTTGTGGGAAVHRRLGGVQEQAAAAPEILDPLGGAGAEPGDTLGTVVDRAARIPRAHAGQLYLAGGDAFELRRVSGMVSAAFVHYVQVARFFDAGAP
ncbi:hypothetical protein NYO98_09120 [Nocardioides sp. STR2]|uniref:Uncharacterized protein n=1 Tax=Nocardioides pini TaxID=2975053 RepID=A0ABT4CBU8_9ACTN|nr:hypothetical protein [Nocardioides pini]MCY4726439.1 hypothetical protein [Nocardioides pini]